MPGDKRDRPTWVRYSGLGLNFVAGVAGFGLIGYWVIDGYFDTKPWGTVVCVMLGLVGATYTLIRDSIAAFKDMDRRDSDS